MLPDSFYLMRRFKCGHILTNPSQLLLWCSPFLSLTRPESSVSPCQKPSVPPSASHTSCTSISSLCFWVSSPSNIVAFMAGWWWWFYRHSKHHCSFPSFRTFYQLSTSVQTAKEALRYQKTESQLSLSHTAATPLLPASFSWCSDQAPFKVDTIVCICSTFSVLFFFFWVTHNKWCLTFNNAVRL